MAYMLDQSIISHITSLLDELPSLQETAIKHEYGIQEYEHIIHEIIALILSSELQLFSSHFAEWTYLIQKSPHLEHAGKLYGQLIALKKSPSTDTHEQARLICRAILSILAGLPEEYDIENDRVLIVDRKLIPWLRGTIQSWEEHKQYIHFICRDGFQREFQFRMMKIHASCHRFWIGATIHIMDCMQSEHEGFAISTEHTLCIIEPDVLYSATEIAECCGNGRHNSIGSMFIKKFSKKQSGIPLLAGIIVGNWLDKQLSRELITAQEIISATLKTMPLQALSAIRDEKDMERLEIQCTELINGLSPLLDFFDGDAVTTEATFLAPRYGLIGRLDILMEFADNPLRKTVIELKSGNIPSIGLPVDLSGFILPMGAWKNHVIQVACYNLLLDSAFPNRIGESSLLYAKDIATPLRNVLNTHHAKREAIIIRNAILSLEHDIINRKFGSFNHLFSDAEIAEMPPFTREEVLNFRHAFTSLDKQSMLYWLASLSFIMREHHSARIGSGNHQGLSSLWHSSIDEKQLQLSAIGYLNIDAKQCDFEKFYLHLDFSEKSTRISSLRKGDLILLYAHDALHEQGTIQGHIHKAVIKEIHGDFIIISLRNKYSFQDHFLNPKTEWCIEADAGNESLFTGIMRSMGDFIRASDEKRDVILGRKRPRKSEPYSGALPEYLHASQKELLKNILVAKDYFLVQGPPGTGKTSALIRSIISILHDDPSETMLLCAYTNRAVDELCSVVNKLGFPFLRLGSKQATAFPEHSLQAYAEQYSIEELRAILSSHRIVISTVSTLHTHCEIHDWFPISTMIVDEASQLLEPQLSGILSHVGRFILIGDERQLPAVITQDIQGTKVNNPLFEEIGLTDFRMSLFERLLRLCIQRNDDHAFGMLTLQARMHEDIAHFVSKFNYENKLHIMNAWQSSDDDIPLPSYPRLTWIDTLPEHQFKIHKHEAIMSVQLALEAIEHGQCDSIGIITPFRSQIALIQSLIPEFAKDKITVDTVERFQGSERDLIIISLAIHSVHHMRGIESITEIQGEMIDRKLNVALTRARKQCIILGCPSALKQDSQYYMLWKELSQ
jgi:DNA replication ATP-dependent helicase Dna2